MRDAVPQPGGGAAARPGRGGGEEGGEVVAYISNCSTSFRHVNSKLVN